MDLQEIQEWADRAFPMGDQADRVRAVANSTSDSLVMAASNLIDALDPSEAGSDEDRAYRLGTSLNALGMYLREAGNHADAVETLKVAHTALATSFPRRDAQPEHVQKAIGFGYANLKAWGQSGVTALTELPKVDAPLVDLGAEMVLRIPDRTPDQVLSVDDLSQETGAADTGAVHRPRGRERHDPEAFERLAQSVGTDAVAPGEYSDELLNYFRRQVSRSGIDARDLGALMREDLERVSVAFQSGMPGSRAGLESLTREARRLSFAVSDDEAERRLRWMSVALANLMLWRIPHGHSTNEPQVQIDLMGYVGGVLMDRRYSDADRDLLLDCAEALVRVGANVTPVVMARFDYLREWVLTAIGTYLLLTGPDPSKPSDSYYDERIQSETAPDWRGLKRAHRHEWAKLLLSGWQDNPTWSEGASFALVSLAGWDRLRAQWLVEQIYPSTAERGSVDARFWAGKVSELLERVDRVRVATNPWADVLAETSRGSMIVSDDRGGFVIPDPVLRSSAAQGLSRDEMLTVHGALFRGRRVPTYLLTNRFGPAAVLKIDHREKVEREVANFDHYARRLHQSNRPSDCISPGMDMYLGEDGAPLRAIETSYVFEEHDEPLTMGSWMRDSSAPEAHQLLRAFFLRTLRPWLAHVRRERVDLRSEYPIFRPNPVTGKQSPRNWAETELERLCDARCRAEVALELNPATRGIEGWGAVEEMLLELAGSMGVELEELVNPVWFASEIAEVGSGELRGMIDSFNPGLRDYDTLVSLSHGDLHLDNVLCTTSGTGLPKTVLIDFESVHEGHVCKDIARVEASVLAQVFPWEDEEARISLVRWYGSTLRNVSQVLVADEQGDGDMLVVTGACSELRAIAAGCGQGHWPVTGDEYLFACLGALLPMVRYQTLSMGQRQLAAVLAVGVATALAQEWAD